MDFWLISCSTLSLVCHDFVDRTHGHSAHIGVDNHFGMTKKSWISEHGVGCMVHALEGL